MEIVTVVLVLVVLTALAFDYVNGFHDTANAIATVVSTGVLSLRAAIILAAILNFGGALAGTAVASTIGKDVLAPEVVSQVLVLSALGGAIAWNLFTWYFGIPSSSSHALIGGLLGAGITKGGLSVIKLHGVQKIVITLITSPLVGFVVGIIVMAILMWLCRRRSPGRMAPLFRKLQLLSASFMAFSHGSNDAQKSMGVITMALVAAGYVTASAGKFPVPLWVVLACAAAMAFGTLAGGVRIIKTMGSKIIDLKPVHGFAAETTAAATILVASHMGMPVSTTHVISASIMGVGASQNPAAVRWGVTKKILWAWVLTIPISAVVSSLLYLLILKPLLGA